MTAADRLRLLAGTTGSAAALLLAIGSGSTTGDALLDYSSIDSGTAAEHLLTEVQKLKMVFGGSGWNWEDQYQVGHLKAKNHLDEDIQIEDEEIIEFLNVFMIWRMAQA